MSVSSGTAERLAWTEPYENIREVRLGNAIGREQEAYIQYIVDNYDNLAKHVVFMHGRGPTCGFGIDESTVSTRPFTSCSASRSIEHVLLHSRFGACTPQGHMRGHMLSAVSVHSYLNSNADVFMPLTARFDSSLREVSWRNSFVYNALTESKSVPFYPANNSGDHWLPFEVMDFNSFILARGAEYRPSNETVMSFSQYYQELFDEPPPSTICFAQG